MQQSFLPEIDQEHTQAAVEFALEKYRMNKFLTFEEREATTTVAWPDSPKGFTGVTVSVVVVPMHLIGIGIFWTLACWLDKEISNLRDTIRLTFL